MNEFLERLTDEYVDSLLKRIDREALDYECYEFGLPLHTEHLVEKFRLIVRKWAHENDLTKDTKESISDTVATTTANKYGEYLGGHGF